MSLFPITRSVASRLEKLRRDFLWDGMGDEHKIHLVSWDRVCSPIKFGGLGFRRLTVFNQALLGKWLWRYSKEGEALWRLVIDVKYGLGEGGWSSVSPVGSYGVSLWRFIRKGWDVFSRYVRFEVGNGLKILFWQDRWCGDTPLEILFPAVFRLATNKDALVGDYLENVSGQVVWSPILNRDAQDWEMGELNDFFTHIYGVKLRGRGGDEIRWSLSSKGLFDVKSFYKALANDRLDVVFPWKSIWRVKVPRRVAFFVWVATHGKILTAENLVKRGFMIVNWCSLCKNSGETKEHVLLHCPFAWKVWSFFFKMFAIDWVMPFSVFDLMCCWRNGADSNKEVWQQVALCVLWGLWRERNNRIFEGVECSVAEVQKVCVLNLFDWARAHMMTQCEDVPSFLGSFRVGE